MGREVRHVEQLWVHPVDDEGNPEPLHKSEMPKFENPSHVQMYEICTEGTPISPVKETPEQLAEWLVENQASAFGSRTATYEEWLPICQGVEATSAFITKDGVISGVERHAQSADEHEER